MFALLQGFAVQGYVTGEGPYANCESMLDIQRPAVVPFILMVAATCGVRINLS